MSLLDIADRKRLRALVDSMHTETHWWTCSFPSHAEALAEWLARGHEERDFLCASIDFMQQNGHVIEKEHNRIREKWLKCSAQMSNLLKDEVPWAATDADRQARMLWNEGIRASDQLEQERLLDEALTLWHLVAAEKRKTG